jgi:hypothetical protein
MSSRSSRRRQGNEHILDRAESALSGRICVEVALTSVAIRDRRPASSGLTKAAHAVVGALEPEGRGYPLAPSPRRAANQVLAAINLRPRRRSV